MKRHSLVFRIALPFAVLLLLTMGGLSLYLSSFIRESYLDMLRSQLTAEARLVADRLGVSMAESPEDPAALEAWARYYARLLSARTTVIDARGNVLAESHDVAGEMENHLDRPEFQRALGQEVSAELRYSDTLQTQMLYAAAPVLVDGEVVGAARLAVSLRAITRSENALLNTILIATAIATGLAIALAILVTYSGIFPLKQLTETAQRMASGDLQEIPSISRRDEIGRLHQAFQDMAHQVKARMDDLRTERAKLEIVLANMTDGILIVDLDGTVQLANLAAERLFHTTVEAAGLKTLIEVVRHHQLVELWRKSNITRQQETTTLETTPGRVFLQGIATPLHESLPGMTLMVFQDLTRVRQLETVRRDFVSNVSHELRTPLASLKALAETLQEGALEDPPAARRFLQRMDTEIDNLTQMVQELLELSRIESNRVPLQRAAVLPCELARPAVERMQLQAERAGLSLRLECPNDLPAVQADPQRIEHVLVNLLHNAIKFTQPGGQIVVSVYPERGQVVFCIRDTGVGISADALPRIFERFYKTDRSRSGGGTGLGLSIARHIIEAHSGRIWAESKENQGSTFYFTLPLA
jgi:two-component system phosphate regulon sensor histidine kinase PhoR